MPSIFGYARTSTADQIAGLDAQQRDLWSNGCVRVFAEQLSAATDNRPMLQEALSLIQPGDSLMVTKPDRLARSTLDLLKIVNDLDARKVSLIILSMGGERLDTRNPTSKLMLTILAGVATWEREIMLERQREGIAKAKADGKYKGRKSKLGGFPDLVPDVNGEKKHWTEVAADLGISHSYFWKLKKRQKSANSDSQAAA